MISNKSLSGSMFAFAIFAGLLPLAFTFSQNEVRFLADTTFQYVVICGQVIVLLLHIVVKTNYSKNQMIGLSGLYLLVPFTFTFSENGISFLILDNYISSALSWAITAVLVNKFIFTYKITNTSKT